MTGPIRGLSLCRYQRSGDAGVPVLLVHGFGANADHWRKNTPVIGEWARCYSIDLLGYGYSDKPDPTTQEKNTIYNFENWAGIIAILCATQLVFVLRVISWSHTQLYLDCSMKFNCVRFYLADEGNLVPFKQCYRVVYVHTPRHLVRSVLELCRCCLDSVALHDADQLEAFIDEVIQEPVVVVCNSVGGMSGLQLAHQVLLSCDTVLKTSVLGSDY